ncbi:MAG: fumarylacetoacetate hydrolase family protein [Ilumatobacter sp.]|uniref:2-keto-4-pentenoate hydratase n=1 Tax=Ilumatobacter sp. TaxID=1967498 RepID=UPI003297014B
MNTEPTDAQIVAIARQLAEAAESGVAVGAMGAEATDLATGYRIQEAGHDLLDDRLIGWKTGCTNVAAQRFLGLEAPVAGRYGSRHVIAAPAEVTATEFATPPHIEVEVGFRLLADIDGVPLDAMQLADAVEVFAAIEVVAGRLASFPLVGGPELVADNVFAARMVVGPTLDLDADAIRALDTLPVELWIDGERTAAGTGADALGHPLEVLSWLAGHAAERGAPLTSGALVITGTCTGMVPARRGASHVGRVGDSEVCLVVS